MITIHLGELYSIVQPYWNGHSIKGRHSSISNHREAIGLASSLNKYYLEVLSGGMSVPECISWASFFHYSTPPEIAEFYTGPVWCSIQGGFLLNGWARVLIQED
jgi:hypothetical protein